MTDDQQVAPLPALAYQPPAEAAINPWFAVVRGIGVAAAALTSAHIGAAVSSLLFFVELRSRQTIVGYGPWQILGTCEALLYLPLLIGGIACARPRASTWKLLTYTMAGLLGLKLLFLAVSLVGAVFQSSLPFGFLGKMAMVGQGVFNTAEDAVPLALMLWLLRLRAIRDVFESPGGRT